MGILEKLKGSGQKAKWQEFAINNKGKFIDGGMYVPHKVCIKEAEGDTLLETYPSADEEFSVFCTRFKRVYNNKEKFYFKMFNKTTFKYLGETLDMDEVQFKAYPLLDKYMVMTNDKKRLEKIFKDGVILKQIESIPEVYVEIKRIDRVLGDGLPLDAEDEFITRCRGIIRNGEKLQSLYELYKEFLYKIEESKK